MDDMQLLCNVMLAALFKVDTLITDHAMISIFAMKYTTESTAQIGNTKQTRNFVLICSALPSIILLKRVFAKRARSINIGHSAEYY